MAEQPPAQRLPVTVNVRAPSRYQTNNQPLLLNNGEHFVPPPQDWLHRTWTVSHSTLKMWLKAKNVRITYKPVEGKEGHIDDLVEYEKKKRPNAKLRQVRGIDKPDSKRGKLAAWNWRGKGWLMIASSHWEVLGYGERPYSIVEAGANEAGAAGDAPDEQNLAAAEPQVQPDGAAAAEPNEPQEVERWVVTWFAPTLFTEEGIDVYSDRKEGPSARTYQEIYQALISIQGADRLVRLVQEKLKPVEFTPPWKEKQ